ncbi:MAG: hypothetical protein IJ433_05490, partial [Ruminococcus sp.]|nr:hypothetical protein [Ruminococcus sp.]
MYNCEIFSVQKKATDVRNFNQCIDDIASSLYQRDIRVLYNTDIADKEKAFTKVLQTAGDNAEEIDFNIFVNALDTKDPSKF